jgi:hypothetical protein
MFSQTVGPLKSRVYRGSVLPFRRNPVMVFPLLPIISYPEPSMPISLLRVETVTPRSASRFLEMVDHSDQDLYDHLCIELVHWGFNEIMAWIYRLKTTCERKRPKIVSPCVSIFGYEDDVNPEMIEVFNRAGALWIPRNDAKSRGKDGATIIREMVTVNGFGCKKSKKKLPFIDPDDYRDLSPYDTSDSGSFRVLGGNFQNLDHLTEVGLGLPDNEFQDMIERTLTEMETFDA